MRSGRHICPIPLAKGDKTWLRAQRECWLLDFGDSETRNKNHHWDSWLPKTKYYENEQRRSFSKVFFFMSPSSELSQYCVWKHRCGQDTWLQVLSLSLTRFTSGKVTYIPFHGLYTGLSICLENALSYVHMSNSFTLLIFSLTLILTTSFKIIILPFLFSYL